MNDNQLIEALGGCNARIARAFRLLYRTFSEWLEKLFQLTENPPSCDFRKIVESAHVKTFSRRVSGHLD